MKYPLIHWTTVNERREIAEKNGIGLVQVNVIAKGKQKNYKVFAELEAKATYNKQVFERTERLKEPVSDNEGYFFDLILLTPLQ